MELKRIIVLANSIKKRARCVAGIEVRTGKQLAPAGWIRPVSGESEGELELRHMRVEGGGPVAVLDIMDVPLTQYAKDPIHPEDWIVDTSQRWTRAGTFDPKTLATLEEEPKDLWLESTSDTDRVTGAFLTQRTKHQSLYLIRPENLRVRLWREFKGYNRKKTRAVFNYRDAEYSLGLTDPLTTDRYRLPFPDVDKPPNEIPLPCADKYLLCVSLTPLYKPTGYHYKVVATVLELP
jgi:hypothetical protein